MSDEPRPPESNGPSLRRVLHQLLMFRAAPALLVDGVLMLLGYVAASHVASFAYVQDPNDRGGGLLSTTLGILSLVLFYSGVVLCGWACSRLIADAIADSNAGRRGHG